MSLLVKEGRIFQYFPPFSFATRHIIRSMALYYGTELPYSAIKLVCQLKLHGDLFKVCQRAKVHIFLFFGGERERFSVKI